MKEDDVTPFTEALLTKLTVALTASVVQGVGRKLRQRLQTPQREQAVERCCQAGVVALVQEAVTSSPEELDVVAHVFEKFFTDPEVAPDVGKAVAELLKGQPLDRDEMTELFEAAGFDGESLPGIELETALAAFEHTFVAAAVHQEALQGEQGIHELRRQTTLQREMLARLEEVVEFLAAARRDSVAVDEDAIRAQRAGGITVRLELQGLPRDTPTAADWERHYLRALVRKCDVVDLSPLDETRPQGAKEARPVRVSDVFTQLHLVGLYRRPDESATEVLMRLRDPVHSPEGEALVEPRQEKKGEEPLPLTAVEAAGSTPRLVVLGQPGGGKSTLVNHLAAQLARARLGEAPLDELLPGWPTQDAPLPVRVVLRRFAANLEEDAGRGDAGLVWEYLKKMLKDWGVAEAHEPLRHAVLNGQGVVFFDGLDEVHEADEEKKRSLLRDSIAAFARQVEGSPVLVTCREYAYRKGDEWRLPGEEFPVVELAPFHEAQIEDFLRTWYRVVVRESKDWNEAQCDAEAAKLTRAVLGVPHLRRLAASPLLLTLMAQLHGRDGSLPEDRADLYERTVRLLLAQWENRIVLDVEGGSSVERDRVLRLGVESRLLREALEEVALGAHERQEREPGRDEAAADIPREDLRDALESRLGSVDEADRVIRYLHDRAGLLQTVDRRTYRFPHRTFQEYLAACHVLTRADYDELLAQRVRRDLPWWREVFLLAAGGQRHIPRTVLNLVEPLVPGRPSGEGLGPNRVEPLRLCAQALVETHFVDAVRREQGERRDAGEAPGRFSRLFKTVQASLLSGLESEATLSPQERAACGDSLALLGDVRPDVTSLDEMELAWVPPGKFWMGEDQKGKAKRHLNEHLDYGYWLGKYPVTVAQFRQAVAEGGPKPQDPDALDGLANHPVVWVSWVEAQDFCEWLTRRWREAGLLPQGWRVGLPSEAEWEKGARGGVEVPRPPVVKPVGELGDGSPRSQGALTSNPDPKRAYPWLGPFDEKRCNSAGGISTGIDGTSSVGAFPAGTSPHGCQEMSGNVFEWTRSLYQAKEGEYAYPYNPRDGREALPDSASVCVVRGGSFFDRPNLVRCAARYGADTAYRLNLIGFRVAVLPLESLDL